MSTTGERAVLRRLAEAHGIDWWYIDAAQKKQYATEASLRGVLKAYGVEVETAKQQREALKQARMAAWKEGLEPVVVAWEGKLEGTGLTLPRGLAEKAGRCRLRLESGEVWPREESWGEGEGGRVERLEAGKKIRRRISWPARLPKGYHQLEVEVGERQFRALVISAPRKVFQPKRSEKGWGLFLPLYAVRSRRNWGAGDFSDLERLGTWSGELGGKTVATLPLLPAFLDEMYDPSPYSPVSRLFLNEFYIDVPRIPEMRWCQAARKFCDSPRVKEHLEECRQERWVDYRRVMSLKRQVLELLAAEFFRIQSRRRLGFEEFITKHPRTREYSRFRAALERAAKPWHDWPVRMREGELEARDYDPRVASYYEYAQWVADEQLTGAAERCRSEGVKLYLDMPLGVNNDGYDVWRYQECFALGASGGAPPDLVFSGGQDWGFSPLHPERIREEGYGYVREYLRAHLRRAGMLRMDHVMGLHRLYWVPRGLSAGEGAYVRYDAEEWHALLALESSRASAWIVGENLGTVPPEVNAALEQHGIGGMYVVQYEAPTESRRGFRTVPSKAVASLNTHDMPTFEGFCRGTDLRDLDALGLLKPKGLAGAQEERQMLVRGLRRFMERRGFLGKKAEVNRQLLRACLRWLGRSAAQVVLVALEDLWQETEVQNLPGTGVERPNWRRKMRLRLEQIEKDPELRRILREVCDIRKGGGKKRTKA